jgi:Domain of unknown function (DUF4276)
MSTQGAAAKLLKIGIVCEGQIGCAEIQVFPHLARLICPGAICGKDEIVPSGNRPNVLKVAPMVAKKLLANGCDAVFVIWDVFPEWREHGGTTDCKVHRATLDENLKTAELVGKPIYPVAVHEELEAWLLCDADALMAVIGPLRQKKKIEHEKYPDAVENPKKKLMELFKLGRGKSYNPSFSAGQIAAQLTTIKRLRKSQSFRRFEDRLKKLCNSKK